jgi:hypothetical protein
MCRLVGSYCCFGVAGGMFLLNVGICHDAEQRRPKCSHVFLLIYPTYPRVPYFKQHFKFKFHTVAVSRSLELFDTLRTPTIEAGLPRV